MINRFYLLLAVVAMAIAMSACGGSGNSTMLNETPGTDNALVAEQSVAGTGELLDGAKGTAEWVPGHYVVTSSATYIDGIDYQFKLLGDNKGSYIWQLSLTNNNWQPRTIHYADHQRRYTFRIDQDESPLWSSDLFIAPQHAGTLVLQPYVPHVYSLPWNGADNHGNPIHGVVTATAIHRDAGNIVSMSGMAWLNGQIGAAIFSEWPMFGRDAQHTRRSSFNGPQTDVVDWATHLPPTTASTIMASPAIGLDGAIYVGAGNWFSAFNPDGTLRWTVGPNPGWYMSSPAIGSDGTIYVGFEGGGLEAYNPDGTLKWSAPTVGEVIASPVIGTDGTIYIASLHQVVTAVNPDGTILWSSSFPGGSMHSSPALSTDGTLYVGSTDGNLYALHPDGTLYWTFHTGGPVYSSPSVGADGTIYVGSDDHNMYAINPDGTMSWAFDSSRPIRSSPAIATDGTIYFGCEGSGWFYALFPTGTMKWEVGMASQVSSSPSIGADGTVYFGADDHNVFAIHPWGTPKWVYNTGGAVDSSPAISKDGHLYILSDDGKLYAFGG